MEHLLDTPTTADYLAVTSVATTTVIAEDGSPRRIPQNPLQAGDFGPFVHSLLTGLGEPDLGKDAKADGSGVREDELGVMGLGGFIGGGIGLWVIRDFYLGGLIGGFVGVLIAPMVASVIEKPTAGSVGTLIGGVIIGGGIGLWAIGGFVGGLVGVIVGVLIGGFIGVLIAIGIEKPTTRSIRTSISEPWATPPQWTRGTWSIGEPNGEPAVEILISDDSPIGRPLAELGDKPDRGKQRRGKVPAKSGQRRTKKRPDQTNQ